jgi:ubiquinone/menaquinone biosynthesis C-methylase UbiE
MSEICDLCRVPALEPVYRPDGTTRGITVHICNRCGLVQSLPRIDRAPRRGAAISGGADWGNVRYGKAFRTEACLELMRRHADLDTPLRVLDVGSNRGSFARHLLATADKAELTAVEPDERVAHSCAVLPRTRLIASRIEDVSLPADSFDIVHSCHTIEHLASPRAVLLDHWRVLKPGGLLILDAPNIAVIGGDDILEEWFIDKHLYHFSAATLARLLASCGFDVVAGPETGDNQNLLFAATKRVPAAETTLADGAEAARARTLLAQFRRTRARNLEALVAVSDELHQLAPRRVALWGAGRLFDALVRHGGFDPASLVALIDTHLSAHMTERHGVRLVAPDALAAAEPGVIVVMSRAFAREISCIAAVVAPRAELVLYGDLLTRARNLRAA